MIFRFLSVKRMLALAAVLMVAIVVALGGVTWYYSSQIESDGLRVDRSESELNLQVVSVGDGAITLRRIAGSPGLDEPGTLGVLGRNGYGQAGAVLELGDDQVTREYRPFDGVIAEGDRVLMERQGIPGHPERGLGLEYEEVVIPGDLGPMPAWLVPGRTKTWAILVHGRTSVRTEMLRILDPVADAGVPALVISYRNDSVSPLDPSGYYGFGLSEWPDLEDAVQYALDHGASDVILVGHSMGGSVTAAFLESSPLASSVDAVILDAPMLDFGETVDFGARRRSVPQFVASLAKWLSARRFGVDWGALDYLDGMIESDLPLLLFHGVDDPTVPVSISDRLARERPGTVTYVRVDGARHVGSWNIDPARYEAAVREFLALHAG